NLNILQVKGRSDLYLRLEIIKKLLVIVAVVLGLRFGIYGLLWGQVAVSIISLFINTFYTAKFLHYTMLRQLADLLPSILIACSVAGVIWWGSDLMLYGLEKWIKAIVIVISYVLSFWCFCALIRLEEYGSMKDLIMNNWRKKMV
ncbi:MAG: polysaccharide biosynthesis C-terminal domain-containing protein, partial [Sphingobacterium sp.]|nr:polysaccharide biosynthesis C-terminal domain-containing protein [Sphingobacterium sp.]